MKKVKSIIGLNSNVQTVDNTSENSGTTDDGYLARQAGLQTVRTSARGILRKNDSAPQRKKLLGE